jgi:hypothetical protein
MKNVGLTGNLGEDRNSFFHNFSVDIRHLTEINITVILNVTEQTLLDCDRRFGRTCYLHLQRYTV